MNRSKLQRLRDKLLLQEDLNFLLTNRIPRTLATRAMGKLSKIENRAVAAALIWVWRLFTDLDLSEAKEKEFKSLHACFTRELREGARPIDVGAGLIVSPCDGILGQCGAIEDNRVFQAKGFPYTLSDLFGSEAAAAPFVNGCYVTLRLTSSMYHRFHAPTDGCIKNVTYISGDTWNVNPIALKRIERLFCRNERAAIHLQTSTGQPLALVAVAAVLVASIRLHFLDVLLHLRWKGPHFLPCDNHVSRGEELGWFEHGSTIILFAPSGFTLCNDLTVGSPLRMGQALLKTTLPSPEKQKRKEQTC